MEPRLVTLSPKDLAGRWGCTTAALSSWRAGGRGPQWFRLTDARNGPVRYRLDDVLAWENRSDQRPARRAP